MVMKKSTIFFLAAFVLSAIGFFAKINGVRIVGDMFLLIAAALFYAFVYFALKRNRRTV